MLTALDGDAWVKLRNDDFSDIEEHYVERGKDAIAAIDATLPGDPPPVIVSGVLVDTIKRMMASDPAERMPLADLMGLFPVVRVRAAMDLNDTNVLGARTKKSGGWRARPALTDEQAGWLEHILAE